MIDREIIAQFLTTLIAFIAFFWIAKKLFWSKVMETIEDRQARIRGEFDKIEAMQKEAAALQASYSKHLAEIENEKRNAIQEEINRGKQIAEEIVDQARREAAAAAERNKQMIAIEMDKARAQLKQDAVQIVLGATEKIIRQRLDDEKQRELVASFVEELSHK